MRCDAMDAHGSVPRPLGGPLIALDISSRHGPSQEAAEADFLGGLLGEIGLLSSADHADRHGTAGLHPACRELGTLGAKVSIRLHSNPAAAHAHSAFLDTISFRIA